MEVGENLGDQQQQKRQQRRAQALPLLIRWRSRSPTTTRPQQQHSRHLHRQLHLHLRFQTPCRMPIRTRTTKMIVHSLPPANLQHAQRRGEDDEEWTQQYKPTTKTDRGKLSTLDEHSGRFIQVTRRW